MLPVAKETRTMQISGPGASGHQKEAKTSWTGMQLQLVLRPNKIASRRRRTFVVATSKK